jgi:hypothetical protein
MPFGTLWLPVVLSAVAVFIISAVLHMALKYHKRDYRPLPNEEAVRAAIGGSLAPGIYFTPYCTDMKQTAEPAMKEKFVKGPVAMITIRPRGEVAMGKHLALWFGFALLVSFVAAYVARHALLPGANGIDVMRLTGTVAFAAYGLGSLIDTIWKGQPWSNTALELLDAAIYSVTTGLLFRLLWPGV